MATTRPNVVLITSDELRADYVGAFQTEMPQKRAGLGAAHLVQTPNIDALAERGLTFTHTFLQHTKCTPSRCSIFTGQYPSAGGHRTLHIPLQQGERHLAETFRQHDYTTVMIGRNHLVAEDYLDDSFDVWLHEPADEPTDYPEALGDPMTGAFYQGQVLVDLDETTDGQNTTATCNWLRNRQEPFFLWYNLFYPHPPYQAPEPYFSRIDREEVVPYPAAEYDDKPAAMGLIHEHYGLNKLCEDDWCEVIATYGGMIAAADDLVGRVLDTLADEGLLENTIIVFMTDHGDFAGQYQLVEKWDCLFHDCLTQNPFILAAPSLEHRGHTVETLVEMVDLAPTLYELCDIDAPPGIAGRSLTDVLANPTTEHRTSVYAEGGHEDDLLHVYNPYVYGQGKTMSYVGKYKVFFEEPTTMSRSTMIRTKKHKLVFRKRGVNELYDLEQDPNEMVNCYTDPAYGDVVQELERRLIVRMLEAQPRLPEAGHPGV